MADQPSQPDPPGADQRRTVALSDDPARGDAFGGHERVATAIREMITTEPGGRTIGLEGEWGSGKSTIVQLVVDGLGPNFRSFVFDTWAHEGDPLRRSFLESLIRDLIAAGWVDPGAWELRIEELARRRRSTTQTTVQDLTPNGRWLAASLFVVPIGTALLSRWLGQKHVDPSLAALGVTITLFPLLLAAFFVAVARPRKVTKPAGLATTDELHPLAILAKANKSIQQSDTIETPEPTSIEFAREFGALVKEALAPGERRLLVVLDNLDRVGAITASEVLATLQTFIGGVAGSDDWESQVWVLLPYDRDGLSELWPEENLVEQVLGKIRQIRFETPPLVLSDWRSHLRRLLELALPDTPATEVDDLVRLVAAVRVERSSVHGKDFAATATPPTPRELVQLVNEIGSVHRQRQELPLTHLAYFAILRREQLDVAIELLEGRVPSERVERLVGAEVRENLAALHFNVEPTRAGQLLLGEPLSASLVRGEPDVVQNLASYPGFWEVVEALPFGEWTADGGMDFALAASALDRSGVIAAMPDGTRRTIAGAIASATTWRLASDQAGDGLGAILLAVNPEPAAASAMLKLVSEKDGKTTIEPPAVRGRVLGVLALLERLNGGGLGAAVQAARIAVPGEAAQFLLACDLLAASDEAGTYWKVLQPSVGFPDVVTAIAGWAGQAPADGRSVAALRVVTSNSARGKWDPAIEGFGTYLRDPTLAFNPAVSFALDVVDVLENAKEGLTRQLADEGWLMNVCYIADAARDAVAASVAALLHLEQLPALPEPPAQANAASGAALLRECLANPAAHADLADALRRLIADKQSDVVFDVAAALPEAAPWAKQCVEDMAKEDRFEAATVVERWSVLDDLADASVLDEMLGAVRRSLQRCQRRPLPGCASRGPCGGVRSSRRRRGGAGRG